MFDVEATEPSVYGVAPAASQPAAGHPHHVGSGTPEAPGERTETHATMNAHVAMSVLEVTELSVDGVEPMASPYAAGHSHNAGSGTPGTPGDRPETHTTTNAHVVMSVHEGAESSGYGMDTAASQHAAGHLHNAGSVTPGAPGERTETRTTTNAHVDRSGHEGAESNVCEV